jgi:subtilisin family serine protease
MRSRQGSFGLLAVVSILLASGAAFMAPDFAAAQYNAGPRMSAPSINISPVGPRSPDFRTPPGSGGGTYTTQSSTGTPSAGKDSTLPRQTKKKADTATAPTTGVTRQISGMPPTGERRFAANEFLIELPGRPTEQAANALAQRHRLTRVESFNIGLTGTTLFRWTLPDGDGRSMREVYRQLEADPNIKVSPNYLYMMQQALASAPSGGDPAQYTLEKLQLKLAHGLATGAQIKVAVIDSGIDATHPELAGTIAGMLDTLEPGEPHTHGTAIAGAIVAQSRLMGVAPRAQILAVRAFDPAGGGAEGTTFNILKGLNWAVANGARVINMSFAGPHDPAMARMLAAARTKGIVLIAAAGNAGPKSPPLYPAADPNVIAVTATDAEDKLFIASNRGNHVAVSAPGVDILLPSPGASYQVSSGTSFAAAHVSGIAALILERKPGLGQDSVRRILLSTAKDLGPKGRDRDFGVGLADAYQALLAAEGRTVDSVAQGTSATR